MAFGGEETEHRVWRDRETESCRRNASAEGAYRLGTAAALETDRAGGPVPSANHPNGKETPKEAGRTIICTHAGLGIATCQAASVQHPPVAQAQEGRALPQR